MKGVFTELNSRIDLVENNLNAHIPDTKDSKNRFRTISYNGTDYKDLLGSTCYFDEKTIVVGTGYTTKTVSDEELKKAIERAATLLKLGVNPSKSNQNAKIETIQESRDGNLINLPSSDLPAIPSFNSKDIQRLFEMQRVPQDLLRKELDFFTQELNIE
ncbi:MAG: hypothetical protein JXA95_18495 [Spirochaetales bacterium]|nr:hypothetical protein [Spirochaetales bacterium]